MALQDNDYVKAPYLQAGDYLKINGTTSGFSIKSDNTGVIYGANDGTLTLGEVGVPTSIPTLDINAREINWNGRPLEEYFESTEGFFDGLDALSSRVDNLQTQLITGVTELRKTDEVFASKIEDLKLESLGASVNILQHPLNDSASNVCGVVIPVSLIQGKMNSFNTIRLGGIQNAVNCYVSIYHSTSSTPSINNQFTLLHNDTTSIIASGTSSQMASVDISLSKNVTLPTSGILLIVFATSSSAPSSTGLDWIVDSSLEANLKLSVYGVGPSNPTSSNGVWLFQKSPNPVFVTFVPDIQIAFIGHANDTLLHVDAALRETVDNLTVDYENLSGRVDSLELDCMTEAETNGAITNYRVAEGGSNLGTLVEQLTTSQQYSLVKGDTQLQFATSGIYLSAIENNTYKTELNFTATDVSVTALTSKDYTGIAELYMGADLTKLAYFKKTPTTDPGSTVSQLVLGSGEVNMQLVDSSALQDRYGFDMHASIPLDESNSAGVRMLYYSREISETDASTSIINMNGYSVEVSAGSGTSVTCLNINQEALNLELSASLWDNIVGSSSNAVPTVSIVHYLIQSALANQ